MAEKQFRNSHERTGRTLKDIKDRHELLKTALMRPVALRAGETEHSLVCYAEGREACQNADYLHQ